MRGFIISATVVGALLSPSAFADACAEQKETAHSYLAKYEKLRANDDLAPRDVEILIAGWRVAHDEAMALCPDVAEKLRSATAATLETHKDEGPLLRRLTATCSRRYDGDDEELAEIVATRADQAKAMLAAMGADTAPCDGQ